MSATVLTIANQKGGVGKTTTAINLAAGLAARKVETLLIDLDPQANASSWLGVGKQAGGSIYGVFHKEGDIEDRVMASGREHLSLIPSESDLAAIEVELSREENYLVRLRELLKPLRKHSPYRVIILDCPPAVGLLSMNALAAADYLLIALQCEYLAMEGLGEILKTVDQLRDAGVNPELSLGGIVMTMFDVRTNLSRQVVAEVGKHFPKQLFKSVIPRSIRLGEAPSHAQTIYEYDPTSASAQAYTELTKEVIKRFNLKQKG